MAFGLPSWTDDVFSGGGDRIFGGNLQDPASGVTDRLGFQNPNSSAEGQALQKQKGDAVTWGSTAQTARDAFGNPIGAPQIGDTKPVVVGTGPNGESLYGPNPSGATVQSPDWQRAHVSSAPAASMNGAQLNTAQSDQTRNAQNQLAGSLQNTANGQGPSVAQEQLRQATAANINQQQAAAQSAHGAARLAAMRNAGAQGAQTQQQAASQAAGLRAQEIAAAQSGLGNVLGVQRGQDVSTASTNAQLQQQTGQINSGYQQGANLFNANALNTSDLTYAGQQNAGNLAMTQANLGAQLGTNQLNAQRGGMLVDALQGAAQGQTGIDTTAYGGTEADNSAKQKATGGGLNALGSLLA